MLFDGKPDGQALTIYFLSLNAVVTISWGAINFLFGGLRFLGEYIEEGSLEPMLATPRDPLILLPFQKISCPPSGDVIQGLGNLIVLFFVAPFAMAGRCVVFTFVAAVAVLGLYILIGSIPFFVRRGNTLAPALVGM
jgi:hypothetical protein